MIDFQKFANGRCDLCDGRISRMFSLLNSVTHKEEGHVRVVVVTRPVGGACFAMVHPRRFINQAYVSAPFVIYSGLQKGALIAAFKGAMF